MTKNRKLFHGWIAAILCTLLAFSVNAMGNNSLSFYIAPISDSLGTQRAALNLALFTTSMLTRTIFGFFYGKMCKRFGVKPLMVVALVLVLAAYLLYSQAVNLTMIGLGAALYGIAHAIGTFGAYNVIINNWFVKNKGMALGMINTAVGVGGMVINPLVSNWIATIGWNQSFLNTGILIAVIAIPSLIFIKEKPETDKEELKHSDAASGSTAAASPVQLLSLGGALKDSRFWLIALAQFMIGFAAGPCFSNVVAAVTSAGVDAALISNVLSVVLALGVTVGNLAGGYIFDRYNLQTLINLGCGVVALGMLIMGFANATLATWILILGVFCIGCGNMLSLGTAAHMINTIFGAGKTEFSAIFGCVFAIHNVGSMIGSPIFGMVYDKTGSYRWGYWAALALLLVIVLAVRQGVRIGRKLCRVESL